MGFAAVGNVKSATTALDAYIKAIGLDQLAQSTMPTGSLDLIRQACAARRGLQPRRRLCRHDAGPPAVRHRPGEDAEGRPGRGAEIPAVFYIPGSSVKDPFSAYQMEPGEKFTKVQLRMGEVYATTMSGYVVFSPSDKALAAATTATKKAADEMSEKQAKALMDAEIAIYANMKVAAPILNGLIKEAEQEMGRMESSGPTPEGLMAMNLSMYRTILSQLDYVALTARLTDTGAVINEHVAYRPDSLIGKAMASMKPPTGSLLGRISSATYILAIGGGNAGGPESAEAGRSIMDMLFNSPALAKLPEETRTKIKGLMTSFSDQVQSTQIVIGGVPAGANGVVGAAIVTTCKDSAEMKKLMKDSAATLEQVIHSIAPDEPDVKDVKVTYTENAETAGDNKLDVLEIVVPKMKTAMTDHDRADMLSILGQENLKILVAYPDKKTVVVTFGGGGAPYMAEAIKNAKGGGTNVVTEKDAGEALKYMPPEKERIAIGMFNVANLITVIDKGMKATGDPNGVPFKITSNSPIVFGAGLSGSTEHVVFYVPNDLVKEGVSAIMGLFIRAPMIGQGCRC